MQSDWPLPHCGTGVFQNLMLSKYALGASAFLNSSISSDACAQYFLINGRWSLSSFTAAFSCACVSSYGLVIPRLAFVFDRYSAASAIWIGLFGTEIWPL